MNFQKDCLLFIKWGRMEDLWATVYQQMVVKEPDSPKTKGSLMV